MFRAFISYIDELSLSSVSQEQELVVDLLLKIPAAAMPRTQRECILDAICSSFKRAVSLHPLSTQPVPAQQWERKLLALMIRFLEFSSASSLLVGLIEYVMTIC